MVSIDVCVWGGGGGEGGEGFQTFMISTTKCFCVIAPPVLNMYSNISGAACCVLRSSCIVENHVTKWG